MSCTSRTMFLASTQFYNAINCQVKSRTYKGVFKGGGSGGSNPPPPPKFSDFFLKIEGKEIERKRKKGCEGGVTS